ncbi:MAG: YadA-like family protein [Neisseriaceae bacterium]|nr:YadA-like family protein [Neisseriaceae bacterium]
MPKNITTQAGDKEVQVALNNDISLNSVTAADKITVGSLTVNQNGKITGVLSDINDDSTAVNVGLLKEELKKGGNYRPITVAGDTGSFEVDNGGKAIWAGDSKNITTAADGDTVKIELNKNIEVDSVKVGNQGVEITQNGLNNGGQVISNVAPGVRPNDAVNVSQLNNATGGVYGRIDSVEKHANAGTAQALAAANMPTASQPGEGILAISAGVYRGEQGYAIGYSHLSENGRWVIRATGSGNSRSHFGGAVGVGFKLF